MNNDFDLRRFLSENKLTKNSKTLAEAMMFDADDYMPLDDVYIGTIVRYVDEPDERFVVQGGDRQKGTFVISLEDDPRDIRYDVKYDDEIIAHALDNDEDPDEVDRYILPDTPEERAIRHRDNQARLANKTNRPRRPLEELGDNELPFRLEVYVNNELKYSDSFEDPNEAKEVAFEYMKDPKATTASYKIYRIGDEQECLYERWTSADDNARSADYDIRNKLLFNFVEWARKNKHTRGPLPENATPPWSEDYYSDSETINGIKYKWVRHEGYYDPNNELDRWTKNAWDTWTLYGFGKDCWGREGWQVLYANSDEDFIRNEEWTSLFHDLYEE